MTEICEFRTAKLTFGNDDLALVVEAIIEQSWETLSFPKYRDQPVVQTLPTLKKIVAHIRRRFQPDSPLHASLDSNPLTLEFESCEEVYEFSQAWVIEWKVYGELGGEMMEEVMLSCEEEVE